MKHRSDPRVLNERTLERDHRVLAGVLRPGMNVLDVGCGTGAITGGIAQAVAPGQVIGLDQDARLLEQARERWPGVQFVEGSIVDWRVPESGRFDIVTAARTLQWIAEPGRAVETMCAATKPGGRVVVLDYNHALHEWDPEPPCEFRDFYRAFLAWRSSNGWSNSIADEMPALFRAAGLSEIASSVEDETDPARGSILWRQVIESIGPAVVEDGFLSIEAQTAALDSWQAYDGRSIRWNLRAIVGLRQRR